MCFWLLFLFYILFRLFRIRGYDVLSAIYVENVLRILMLTELPYLVEILFGK